MRTKDKRRTRSLAIAALAATAAVVLAFPGTAASSGATQSLETFTNQPGGLILFEDPCTGQLVGGITVDTGWVRTTETPNGGTHVRGHVTSTVDLYVALSPPPDLQFGPLLGTWTFATNFEDEVTPGGAEVHGFVESGTLTRPDGTTSHLTITLRMVIPPDGALQVFFVKAVCGG